MHKITPVRHHPDIRWVITVTVLLTTALVLLVYTMWDLTKPVPALQRQNQQQSTYLTQLSDALQQLTRINLSLEAEIKNRDQVIKDLRLELSAKQSLILTTSTTTTINKK